MVIFIMLDEKEHSIFSCRGIRGLLLKNIQRIFYWDFFRKIFRAESFQIKTDGLRG